MPFGNIGQRQIAFGVVASALTGAGLLALIAALLAGSPRATIQKDNLAVATALPQPSNASPSPMPVLSAPATVMTSSAGSASAPLDGDAAERNVLERARASLGRAAIAPNAHARDLEIAAALSALADHERRFPDALYSKQRELLRRQIVAYQAEHQAEDVSHR